MDLKRLYDAIVAGDDGETGSLAQQALAEGVGPQALLREDLIPAMDEVGRRFESSEYFVPELLRSARAMRAVLDLLQPLLRERGARFSGRVAIGTVRGDFHHIGKDLVAAMLEGAGFEVVDLGVDVAPERFVSAVRNGAEIVALSALLTTTMPAMRKVVSALEEAGLRRLVTVMIGGAPVTQRFADEIGADAFGANAAAAVRIARELMMVRGIPGDRGMLP